MIEGRSAGNDDHRMVVDISVILSTMIPVPDWWIQLNFFSLSLFYLPNIIYCNYWLLDPVKSPEIRTHINRLITSFILAIVPIINQLSNSQSANESKVIVASFDRWSDSLSILQVYLRARGAPTRYSAQSRFLGELKYALYIIMMIAPLGRFFFNVTA